MNDYWNGIYGQSLVKTTLSNLLASNKIPHAFLFQGIPGIGKEFFALRFAEALNKKSGGHVNPKILNSIASLSEPYIKYIIPLPRGKNETDENNPTEKLSNDEIQLLREELEIKIANPYYKINLPRAGTIKINSIRDIKKFLSLSFTDLAYRIILISDAHLMNEAAQNALLKNLEEPPEGVIIILTTPFPSLLRDTIKSRCWILNFQPLANDDIKNILVKYFNAEEKLAEEAAPFAGGSVQTAVSLLEHDFENLRDRTILILRYSLGRKYHSALNEFSSFLSSGDPESIKLLIQMIIVWLNDLQKYRTGAGNYFFERYLETLEKFHSKFPGLKLDNIVSKLDRLSSLIQNNVNINLIVLNLIYELGSLTAPGNRR
ncbi:MAG TPA: DNA polymerase III subunit delta' C-terminal domain-containing protein [Ignavibacteriaceae bacterium]|nr:DNA polymerase III subunit delta' C-terminal domain-containing protein [Ignavibacteriaceae bacterium]